MVEGDSVAFVEVVLADVGSALVSGGVVHDEVVPGDDC